MYVHVYLILTIKVRKYVTRVNVWTFKVYSITTRLHVTNHRSLFFYLNIVVLFFET